jgi:signal transduction histidine kinase
LLAPAAKAGSAASLRYRVGVGAATRWLELQVERPGGATALVGLCRDVTAQQQAHAAQLALAVAQAERRQRTELLAQVSHELRTPMYAMLGFVDLLRGDREHPLDERQLGWSAHVMDAGRKLVELTDDLLDLTRLDSGHHVLKIESLSVGPRLANCLALLEPLALRQGCSLAPAEGQLELHVQADERALSQVLTNVIANAIKFNRVGGQVRCTVWHGGTSCVVEVCDDGPGIAPALRGRLFQPFERLGRSSRKPDGSSEGSGLGLAITQGLVQAMQGRIGAEFPATGGTCLRIELPLA